MLRLVDSHIGFHPTKGLRTTLGLISTLYTKSQAMNECKAHYQKEHEHVYRELKVYLLV